jgi:hypothetical protein
VALKGQLWVLSNLEANDTRLHLEHRVIVIYFFDLADEGQPTTFVTFRLGKTWNHVKSSIKAHGEKILWDRSNHRSESQRICFEGNGVKASHISNQRCWAESPKAISPERLREA